MNEKIHGYTEQPPANIAGVNTMKIAEERVLRALDALAEDGGCDPRWLAIGRTHIEQGFMAINRSIFKPQRIDTPDV